MWISYKTRSFDFNPIVIVLIFCLKLPQREMCNWISPAQKPLQIDVSKEIYSERILNKSIVRMVFVSLLWVDCNSLFILCNVRSLIMKIDSD